MSDEPTRPARRLSPANTGLAWGAAAQVGGQIIRLVAIFVLARQLAPRDFGLVAACMVVTDTASRVAGFGLLPAVTARDQIDDRELSTLFWFSAAMGTTLWGIVYLAADGFAVFLEDPESARVLRWLALVFLPAGLSSVPIAILTRRLDFRALAIGNVACALGGSAIGISMALSGAGVHALVAYTIAPVALRLAYSLYRARWRPALHFSLAELRSFAAFGSASLGSEIAGILGSRLDLLLIARAVGTVSAGYYSFAVRIIEGPRLRVSGIFGRVLFAVAARERGDPDAFRSTAIRLLKQQCLVVWPALLGLTAISRDAVLTAVGETWLPAIPPLQVICVTSLMRSFTSFCTTVQTASGHPRRPLATGILGIVGLPPVVALCAPHGLIAVALGIGALSLLTLMIGILWLPRRYLRPRDLLRPLITPAAASSSMIGAIWLLSSAPMVQAWSSPIRLCATTIVGAAVYIGIASCIDREALVASLQRFRR